MKRIRTFLADPAGASAAEFALVLPVALLFLLGIIDVGRYFWSINQLEKAVQIGTRYAVATAIVPTDLNTIDYTGFECPGAPEGGLRPGDAICKDALGKITCIASSVANSTPTTYTVTCTCAESGLSGSCPGGNTDDAAFAQIVNRMRTIAPMISPDDVRITYSGSGIGYAGDPRFDDAGTSSTKDDTSLSEIAPVVTVQVLNQRLRTFSLLGLGMRLPSFQYSQTLEDGEGAIAY